MKIGILPLGRETFDVTFATEKLAAMLAALDATGHAIVGPRDLCFDGAAADAALAEITAASIDHLLILQVTFTDAGAAIAAANAHAGPLSIWAVPEPRLGGRLRLNAFCGLNLASHALGLAGRNFGWAYGDEIALDDLLAGRCNAGRLEPEPRVDPAAEAGPPSPVSMKGRRIARLGAHPDGFATCAYDGDALAELAGVTVDELPLSALFAAAQGVDATDVAALRGAAGAEMSGLEDMEPDALDKSLRLKLALDGLTAQGGYDAFAIRCWPETFTEYGGAVCGPVSMLGEARVPCACEADVYGALTQMILQDVADAPVFLADIVDMDVADNSGVVWHCGQAPISMQSAGKAAATIHTNRRLPLLYEFALKPGPVTLMRISQAHGSPKMILSRGDMLDRPMAFTGTSGVIRFDRPISAVLPDLFAAGLEHHMALAYGDHVAALRDVARSMNLPVIAL